MLTNHEPDRNIEDLTDTEIYGAIRYLEPDPKNAAYEMDGDDRDKDNGVVICVFLYVALLVAWPSCGSTGDNAHPYQGPNMRLIGKSWNPATISALAATFGSLIGALASSVSNWITQKHQGRRDLRISWLSESLTASSYIPTLSAKARMPWLTPSNITFRTRITSPRPMRF
jgi:hypothetical protein